MDVLKSKGYSATNIFIAHRLQTIKNCDSVLVIAKDGCHEFGSHEDLLKNPNGIYRKLWDEQQK